ncbi:hypothetical protein ACFX1S_003826 [Malus domestica]
MAKLVLLIALCVLSALAAATGPMKTPFTVEGKVYCDTCCAGYETKAITYIAGAKVRLECRDKSSMALVYTKEGTTDSAGCYKILVAEDHLDQIELVRLVSESVNLMMVNNEEKRIKSERLGFDWVGPQVGRGQTTKEVLMIN